jgi:hypothetical protein
MSNEDVGTNTGAGLDFSSAMVRAEARHLDATLHALVRRLSSVPGLKMEVSYRHGKLRRLLGDLPYINDLHRRTDPVHTIVVVVGTCSYRLRSEHGSIKCGREITSIVPGQVKEELSFSVWATTLFDEIAQQNFVNHDSMVALRHLVEQDRVE